jgi:hypothetical protein
VAWPRYKQTKKQAASNRNQQTYGSIKSQKINFKLGRNGVNDLDEQGQWSSGHDHNQGLASKEGENDGTNGLT